MKTQLQIKKCSVLLEERTEHWCSETYETGQPCKLGKLAILLRNHKIPVILYVVVPP
jgi:hypothetical protein